MSEIFNLKSIQTLTSRVTAVVSSAISHARFKADSFEKQPVMRGVSNYLSDVVFEKSGHLFPKIKAFYHGKPIATTKKELFDQISALNIEDKYSGPAYVKRLIKRNISKLENKNCTTFARISKFIHEISAVDNPYAQSIKSNICSSQYTLSVINKVLAHPRNLSINELVKILDHLHYNNFKNLDILLNTDPSVVENRHIAVYMEMLPYKKGMEEENIRTITRIREKLASGRDQKIKDFVIAKLSDSNSELIARLGINPNCFFPKEGMQQLDEIELLLDAYHCARNRYSLVDSDVQEYYKRLKQMVESEAFEKEPKEIQELHMKELQGIPALDSKKMMNKYGNPKAASRAELFNESVRLEPLKNYIALYAKKEPEMANYLYERYFLTKIPEKSRDSYRRIRNEFGTYVFTENSEVFSLDNRIYSQLDDWRKASSGKAKYPTVIDFSRAKKNFIDEKPADAFFSFKLSSINFQNDSFYWLDQEKTFRHEMTHLNDPIWERDGLINGINVDQIIKSKLYAQELRNAGIKEEKVEYAHTNKRELLAVAATGDYRKYSEEFKQVLVRLGMPEWIFNLKPLHNADIKTEELPKDIVSRLENYFIFPVRLEKNADREPMVPIVLLWKD